jgi:hypothetical protein
MDPTASGNPGEATARKRIWFPACPPLPKPILDPIGVFTTARPPAGGCNPTDSTLRIDADNEALVWIPDVCADVSLKRPVENV